MYMKAYPALQGVVATDACPLAGPPSGGGFNQLSEEVADAVAVTQLSVALTAGKNIIFVPSVTAMGVFIRVLKVGPCCYAGA